MEMKALAKIARAITRGKRFRVIVQRQLRASGVAACLTAELSDADSLRYRRKEKETFRNGNGADCLETKCGAI